VLKLTEFNRLLLEATPLWQEVSVFKINIGVTDQVIAEKEIVIHALDLKKWCTRECCLKVELFANNGVQFVDLVIFAFVMLLLTKFNN